MTNQDKTEFDRQGTDALFKQLERLSDTELHGEALARELASSARLCLVTSLQLQLGESAALLVQLRDQVPATLRRLPSVEASITAYQEALGAMLDALGHNAHLLPERG